MQILQEQKSACPPRHLHIHVPREGDSDIQQTPFIIVLTLGFAQRP
jgi:hypothetical protein